MRASEFPAISLLLTVVAGCSRVLPVAEQPAIDLGAAQNALLGEPMWSHAFGGPPDQPLNHYGRSVAVDSAGNVIISGEFSGTADFGCGPLLAIGNSDAFAAKLSPGGVCQWSVTLGRSGANQFGRSVAIDPNDDVLLAGDFRGSIDFGACGSRASAGGNDIFLAKLGGADGSCLWAKKFGDAASQFGRSVAVGPDGSVIMAGEFFGSIPDFGGDQLISAGDSDIYVAKFSAGGVYQWAYRYGDPSTQVASSVGLDSSNGVLLTGSYQGSQVDFGGGSLPTTQGGPYMFVAKFNDSGAHQWSNAYGDNGEHRPNSLKVASSGEFVVAGDFNGILNLRAAGCPVLSSTGAFDIFLAKFNSTGACLWSKRFGTNNNQSGTSVALGPQDTIFLTGFTYGPIDFGDSTLQYRGGADAFLAKFSTSGMPFGSASYGDPQDQSGQGVAVHPATGNVVITGYFAGAIDFGGQPLLSPNGFDIFVAQSANGCDASNCSAGCCEGSVCRDSSVSSCGTLGSACIACDLDKADNCATGQCRCGTQAPCGAGQHCVGGLCRCDSASCPTGCCNGATCTVSSFSTCGSSGAACVACDGQRADNCSNGQCRCGLGAACSQGQYCEGGACKCGHGHSCQSGCCDGDICRINEFSACGTAGGSCTSCSPASADNCANGQCRCGSASACSVGQHCVGGSCRCDASSCPNGCCDGNNICRSGTELTACGTGGQACSSCSGDTCSGGTCGCLECGSPGSCHQCTCTDLGGQCGQYPSSCHVCDCHDFGTCDPTETCAWYMSCGEWPHCEPCSGAQSPDAAASAASSSSPNNPAP